MDGDRIARLVPVVLAVILGLLGMHALVVADGDHSMPSTPRAVIASPATTMSMSGESATSPPEHAPTPYAPTAQSISTTDVLVPGTSPGGHSYGHEMLHLCLAVLAALLVLLVGLVLASVAPWRDDADGWSFGRGRRDPPRRPPPTSVRLAQLCVMRN